MEAKDELKKESELKSGGEEVWASYKTCRTWGAGEEQIKDLGGYERPEMEHGKADNYIKSHG